MQLYAIVCMNIQICENVDIRFEAKSYYIYARVLARMCVFKEYEKSCPEKSYQFKIKK